MAQTENFKKNRCREIITGTAPGPGQSHGCPFRHYSTENLTAALTTGYSLTSVETKEILASVKSQHYHLACTRLFEIQNKVEPGEGLGGGDNVDHPNKYFDASWKMEKEKLELNKVKAEGEPMDVE